MTTSKIDNLKNSIHVGLLTKLSQNATTHEWHSPGDASKRDSQASLDQGHSASLRRQL